MRELLNFLKDLFLIKHEDTKLVGLTSLKKAEKPAVPKPAKKKDNKEIKLSDLMRRHKQQGSAVYSRQPDTLQQTTGTVRPAVTKDRFAKFR